MRGTVRSGASRIAVVTLVGALFAAGAGLVLVDRDAEGVVALAEELAATP